MANFNSSRSGDAIWARSTERLNNGNTSTTAAPVIVTEDVASIVQPRGASTPLTDAAEFNASFGWESTTGLPRYINDLLGDSIRGNEVFAQGANEPGTVRWQLDSGWSQDVSDNVITWGFADYQHAVGLNNNPGYGEGPGYTPFTQAQRDAAFIAIQNWDDLIAPTYQYVPSGPGASDYGRQTMDIVLANTSTGPAQAWAYYPGYPNPNQRVAGDVWIADPRLNPSNLQFDPGFYGLQTLNHELGHAVGLSHPGAYNFGDDNDGDGQPDPITYEGDAFYFQDSNQFSIMSYFDSFETGAQNVDWNLMRFVYPSTPMIDDVFVAQQKYGADMTTRTGDTTYGFNATDDVTNDAMSFEDGEMFTLFTIWDAAGNDTLDLSGYYTDSVIDLREGAYSSAGGAGAYDPSQLGRELTLAEINANNAEAGLGARSARLHDIYYDGVAGTNEGNSWAETTGSTDDNAATQDYLMQQNIGIAWGAIIENAIGGEGNDRINGNQADNFFTGNGGADTFILADYSGQVARPDAVGSDYYVTIDDNSVDTITDFESGVDRIDLTSFAGVTAADVSFNDATDVLTVNTANGVFTAIVHGDNVAVSDFIFG